MTEKATPQKLAYSLNEAAQATGLSKSHLDRAIKAGDLPARKSGTDKYGDPVGKILILTADLTGYLDGLARA